MSDALDVGAGLLSARTTGARGVLSAAIVLPVAALDVWALALLRRGGAEPTGYSGAAAPDGSGAPGVATPAS